MDLCGTVSLVCNMRFPGNQRPKPAASTGKRSKSFTRSQWTAGERFTFNTILKQKQDVWSPRFYDCLLSCEIPYLTTNHLYNSWASFPLRKLWKCELSSACAGSFCQTAVSKNEPSSSKYPPKKREKKCYCSILGVCVFTLFRMNANQCTRMYCKLNYV